jgi:hypothetical protein
MNAVIADTPTGVASSTSDHRAAVEAFKSNHRLETAELVGE